MSDSTSLPDGNEAAAPLPLPNLAITPKTQTIDGEAREVLVASYGAGPIPNTIESNSLPMCKITISAIAALLCFAGVALAENSACWGGDSREDITCTKVTEKLLLGFRGQTIDSIRKAMKAPGRGIENGLHFLSNYSWGEKTGSGDVNVTFEDGRATIVNAFVDSPSKPGQFEFVWNAYAAPPLGEE